MKRVLLPLLALAALAATACSHPNLSKPVAVKAVPAGTLQTAWGELPTYRAEGDGPPFAFDLRHYPAPPADLRSGDRVVLDVLVNRDGSIRDVKVQTSSGFEKVDQFAANRYVAAHSVLQIPDDQPAPYVVRQTFAVGGVSLASGDANLRYGDNRYSDRVMGTGARHPMDH